MLPQNLLVMFCRLNYYPDIRMKYQNKIENQKHFCYLSNDSKRVNSRYLRLLVNLILECWL